MKNVVRSSHWSLIALHNKNKFPNGSVVRTAERKDVDLLSVVLQQMNLIFVLVPTPEDFEMCRGLVQNLIRTMIAKAAYIALCDVGKHILLESYFDATSTYNTVRWYVPCSVKYPTWSSIFRTLSVNLWIVLIFKILIVAISTTRVGQYSCASKWQGYKTLRNSLTIILAVILGVSVSTMPRTPSLRSLFLAWGCFSLAFITIFLAFLTTFLIDSGYKRTIQNIDELFASGIKLAYTAEYNFLFENGEEKELSKL